MKNIGKELMTTKEMHTQVVQIEFPVGLLNQAQDLIETGWFRNLDELLIDALRRYLESHRGELMEEFNRQDVEWGLVGND